MICLLELHQINNLPEDHKLLRAYTLQFIENSMLKVSQEKMCPQLDWEEFRRTYSVSNSGMDKDQVMIRASAQLAERDIYMVEGSEVIKYGGGRDASKKPPLWIGSHMGEYFPLYQHQANPWNNMSSNILVRNDIAYVSKDEISDRIQKHVSQCKKKEKLGLKVLGYMSKVIPQSDRIQSIWKKEASALINGLAKFKPLIEISPLVLCMVDSQVVYFLSHKKRIILILEMVNISYD